jgi:GMP synthase-like glutamine amidotransferase
VGIHTVQLNREFVDAFPLALGNLPDGQLKIQMFHGDRVMVKGGEGVLPETAAVVLPSPWMNIGSTPICPIQGMYYPGRVLSVQGHYELDAFGMQKMCLEFAPLLGWTDSKLGLFLEQVGFDYGRRDDSGAFALAMVCFLAGEEK